ncbi:MAG: sulfite oxidase heme-binding subunit YedZ [Methylomonas sp.]
MVINFKNPWHISIIACFLPLFFLLIDVLFNNLGGNPIQTLHIRLGDWSLNFLCVTLAITPIQVITRWRGMADYRQLFGLCCFGYSLVHVLVYLVVDNALNWSIIATDVIESPYIWLGLFSFLIITVLAITSPNYAKKKLGKNWKKIHRLIYFSALFAVIHYLWQLKGNLVQPIFYGTLISLLLLFRLLNHWKNKRLSKLMVPKRPVSE